MADKRKVVMIAGAGATRSDAEDLQVPKAECPPLDRGFFAGVKQGRKDEYDGFLPVGKYMADNYGIDITDDRHDSLEKVMGVIYSDAVSSTRGADESGAGDALRHLLLLVPRRIADTTNPLVPSAKSNICRIASGLLREGVSPNNLTIITFNYDLQAEKALHIIHGRQGGVFDFPRCYGLPPWRITRPRGKDAAVFRPGATRGGVRVLKLHGSLNWLGMHPTFLSAEEMLASSDEKNMRITPRISVNFDMKIHRKIIKEEKAEMETYPLIIPPVAHKAALFPAALAGIWQRARDALKEATDVVIFGYSCPQQDTEVANLIGGGLYQNPSARVCVIDISSATVGRYIDLTGLSRLHFYRTAGAFVGDKRP